ncbi:MAG: hypothetical protein ACXIVQ_12425 [Acidimicrobiales bacterium]
MNPHRFDPVSAVLGAIAVAVGLLVATDSYDRLDTQGGWWLALGILALGIAVVASAARRLRSDEWTEASDGQRADHAEPVT